MNANTAPESSANANTASATSANPNASATTSASESTTSAHTTHNPNPHATHNPNPHATPNTNPAATTAPAPNLDFIFFEAIDTTSEAFVSYKSRFSPARCFMLHGRILSDNEIACYASHFAL
ncbi:hypothetical protein BKN38_08075 [Helicobacter sp. CLO-3]|nr:hypothetical protein BKN38_08075 [Helicobacter sp. CLO-3]